MNAVRETCNTNDELRVKRKIHARVVSFLVQCFTVLLGLTYISPQICLGRHEVHQPKTTNQRYVAFPLSYALRCTTAPITLQTPAPAPVSLLARMRIPPHWNLGIYIILCKPWRSSVSPGLPFAAATPVMEIESPTLTDPSQMSGEATCHEWASWVPPRTDPALVMQVVSEDHVKMQLNFMLLMERNSVFTRDNMYLMCMDDASITLIAAANIRCVPLSSFPSGTVQDLWRTRIRALSCLVREGYDVVMSDSDAVWLRDPMEYFDLPNVRTSSVVASRGRLPHDTFDKWGTSICMGFILFRATGPGMDKFLETMETLVSQNGDDQVSANRAIDTLGVIWDDDGDMQYRESVGLGRGTIDILNDGHGPFVVTLLPHKTFTRQCRDTPVSNETVVAHCTMPTSVFVRERKMKRAHFWLLPGP